MKKNNLQKSIPTGWKEIKLGDVLKVGSGKDYKHLKKGDIPVFGTGGYMVSVDKPLYSGETVFIGRKGTIDKPFYFKGDFWTVDTLFYTYNYKNTIAKYINFVFQKINWKLYNEASGVPSLSKNTIEKIKFIFPPLPEQKRIVSVLESWDYVIEKLVKKIKIKKNIKKGLMQKLLTGAVRLTGFTDKWRLVKLGNICDISRGGSPRPIQDYLTQEKDGLNWLRIGDIEIGSRYIYKTREKIKKEGLSKTTLVNDGDFILSNSMSFGRPYIMKTTACIHDGWLTFKNIIPDFNKDYLYYLLLSNKIQNIFKSISAGSGVQNLKKESVSSIIIQAPSKKEQLAIVGILTAVDNEIDVLEKKLSILKDQKKYLLNNLITGTIRTKA